MKQISAEICRQSSPMPRAPPSVARGTPSNWLHDHFSEADEKEGPTKKETITKPTSSKGSKNSRQNLQQGELQMKRGIALLVMIFAVCLFSAYVSSVRANGQATPCDGGDGSQGTLWKWGFCHNHQSICTGDAQDVAKHTGHSQHGPAGNPGCRFVECCSSDTDDVCKDEKKY